MRLRRRRPAEGRVHVHLTWDGAIQASHPEGFTGFITRDDLVLALGTLRDRGGELIYSRDRPERDPPEVVVELFKLVMSYDLRINLLDEPARWLVPPPVPGGTALMGFAHGGDTRLAADLLDRGAEVDERDADGLTALMYAAMAGHREVVGLLLERRADPTLRDHQGRSAADLARQQGHRRVRALLDRT